MTFKSAKCYSTAIYTTILVVLSLQLLGTIEKQVFDFLGYMWAPIIGNFFQIICTILGIFGTCQHRPKFVAVYSTWSLLWLGWNIFVICLYLEVGVLNRNRDIHILNIGTKNKSWWLEHGIGCRINNDSWTDIVQVDNNKIIPPEEFIEGCVVAYYYVEVIHAGVQCLLALTGFVFTCMAIYIFAEDQETTSTANNDLEFVKTMTPIRSQTSQPASPAVATNPTYEPDTQYPLTCTDHNSDYPTYDGPPSYETSMHNNVNKCYGGSDRQSVHSSRSTRSKASTRSKRTRHREERVQRDQQDLPWVQIIPSSNNSQGDFASFRHFP